MRRVFGVGVIAVALTGCADLLGYRDVVYSDTTSTGGGGGTGGSGASGAGGALCAPGDVQSCYTGKEGTQGVGDCKAGAQTCAQDGASWGDCAGEVLPAEEKPEVAGDEACDGYEPGEALWSRIWGDGGSQSAAAVTTDSAGNIYVAGMFNGSMEFDAALVSSGEDGFVVKLGPSGEPVWSRQLGDAAIQAATTVVADAGGNVVVAGVFRGDIDLDEQHLSTGNVPAIFVIKLDTTGHAMWARQIGAGNIVGSMGVGLAVAPNGDVVLTNGFSGTLSLAGNMLTSVNGLDVFICKLSGADGAVAWAKQFGGPSDQLGIRVATDAGSNIIVSGLASGTFDVGFDTIGVASGDLALFLMRLDPQGNPDWAKGFKGVHGIHGMGIDGSGGIFVGGRFSGTTNLGATLYASQSASDIYVARFLANGKNDWVRYFGDSSFVPIGSPNELGPSMAVGSDGTSAIVFHAGGAISLGGPPLDGAAASDFLAVFDADGSHRWSKVFGESATEGICATAIATGGDIVLACGVDAASMNYGNGPLEGSGTSDLTVARFAP